MLNFISIMLGFILLLFDLGIAYHLVIRTNTKISRIICVCSIICAIGIFFLLYPKIQTYKNPIIGELSTRVEDKAKQVFTDANEISKIKKEVTEHKNYIEMIIRDANQAQSSIHEINAKVREAESALKQVKSNIEEAKTTLNKMQELSELHALIIAATNDDRKAFDDLRSKVLKKETIARTSFKTFNILHQIAMQADPRISVWVEPSVTYDFFNINNENHSLDLLKDRFPNIPNMYANSFIGCVWDDERLTQKEKLVFLVYAIKNTTSVRALHKACAIVNKEAKLNKNILDYEAYLNWWNKNKDNYQ